MSNAFKFIGMVAVVAMIGFSMSSCPIDGGTNTGTFRIRITDIPLAYFNAANASNGRFEIGLFPGGRTPTGQAPSMANLIAGRDTRFWGDDLGGTVPGSGWFEFYFYPIEFGDPFVGPAGNYDIGLQMFGPGNTLRYAGALLNVRLEVNRVNAISFSAFTSHMPGSAVPTVPPPMPTGDLAAQLAWIRTHARAGDSHTLTISRDESLTPAQAALYGANNLTITLRGDGTMRTVSLATSGTLFDVESGVTLILDNNVTLRGRANNSDSLVRVWTNGTLVMNDGARITGNTTGTAYTWGGGVLLVGGGSAVGTFTMYGGEISNNSATWGGGVYVEGGIFTMHGGAIANNTARASGGGVYLRSCYHFGDEGVFIMHNGTISGNTVTGSYVEGGGVRVSDGGIFTMHNGRIIDNTVSSSTWAQGGGVSVGGTFTMLNGEIQDNTATGATSGQGGGVLVSCYCGGLFVMRGGEISGNAAVSNGENWANGGGVFVSGYSPAGGTFHMSGGVIYDDNIIRHFGNMGGSSRALTIGTFGANSVTARFGSFVGDSFSRVGDFTTTNDTVRIINGVWSNWLNYMGSPTGVSGEWSVFDDRESNAGSSTIAMTETVEDGMLAFHLVGQITTSFIWGFAGLMLELDGETLENFGNAMAISFMVRGDGQTYSIEVQSSDVNDYGFFFFDFGTVAGEATRVTIPMLNFAQPTWAAPVGQLRQNMVTGLQWTNHDSWRPGPFELSIWDVRLYLPQ